MTDASAAGKAEILESILVELTSTFGLGEVRERRFLADELMNANWRIDTPAGVFALKRVPDVSLDRLRRNLGVLASLAGDGLPVTAPVATASGSLAAEVSGGVWCLFPWAAGVHVRGVALSLEQVAELGTQLGRLHDGLGRACARGLLPAVPDVMAADVTSRSERSKSPSGCPKSYGRRAPAPASTSRLRQPWSSGVS